MRVSLLVTITLSLPLVLGEAPPGVRTRSWSLGKDRERQREVRKRQKKTELNVRLPLRDSVWYENNYRRHGKKILSGAGHQQEEVPWMSRPQLYNFSVDEARECLKYGQEELGARENLEQKIQELGLSLAKDSPANRYQRDFKESDPFSNMMAKQAFVWQQATAHLVKSSKTKKATTFDLRFQGNILEDSEFCNKDLVRATPSDCAAFRHYRSIDGTCNNLKETTWGATFTELRRLVPPTYDDDVSEFRKAKSGAELPNPRVVSTKLALKRNFESYSISLLHMSYGQFLDHDLDFSPLPKGADGKDLPCCPDALGGDPTLVHQDCAPIPIPEDDPFYSQFNQTCMEFVRSVASSKCVMGPRLQVNEKTSYLDGSLIYGGSQNQSDSLRAFTGGILKYQVVEGEELLPANKNMSLACNKEEKARNNMFCFMSGDHRVNVQPLLTIFHVVWTRHHNHLARRLTILNPHWDDEKLFQEARRILVAQFQHVTYSEYLLAIFGRKLMKQYDLLPLTKKQRNKNYDEELSASVSAEFSGAAFRFGHSQIPGHIQSMDAHGDISSTEISSKLMNPFDLYRDGEMLQMLRGEMGQSAATVDTNFSPEMAGKLFRGDLPYGLDLVALNIQRGRDHGLPSYNSMRASCNLRPAVKFNHLKNEIDKETLRNLRKVYSHVEDIDLFIGGLAETPLPNALVGPTFACILLDQFYRLKEGDRFWYETNNKDTKFKTAQLVEIRRTNLARILCDAIPGLEMVQPSPLLKEAPRNPLTPCSNFEDIDLSPWKE